MPQAILKAFDFSVKIRSFAVAITVRNGFFLSLLPISFDEISINYSEIFENPVRIAPPAALSIVEGQF